MSRIDVTIFLLTASRVCRADFAGRNASRVLQFKDESRPAGLSFKETLEHALTKSRHVGRHSIVLDTSIWSQVVSIPKASIVDVEPDELQQALKFEVETLSGIDAEQAVLGVTPLDNSLLAGNASAADVPDTQQAFWVNVAYREHLEFAMRRLKQQGARSVALAHPAGLSKPASQGLALIELWDDLAVLLNAKQIRAISARSSFWQEQFGLSALEDTARQSELIVESGEFLPSEYADAPVRSLDQADDLQRWLQSLARRSTRQSGQSLPWLMEQDDPAKGTQRRLAKRVVLAGMFVLFCLVHFYFLKQRDANLDRQQARLERPTQLKQKYDSELTNVLRLNEDLKQEASEVQSEVKQIDFLFDYQTDRLQKFLEFLMVSRTDDLVIREIALDEIGTVVKGYSLSGNSAPMLANALREKAMPLGWRIHAPSQIGQQKMISGGPWEFTVLFEDVGPGQVLVVLPTEYPQVVNDR